MTEGQTVMGKVLFHGVLSQFQLPLIPARWISPSLELPVQCGPPFLLSAASQKSHRAVDWALMCDVTPGCPLRVSFKFHTTRQGCQRSKQWDTPEGNQRANFPLTCLTQIRAVSLRSLSRFYIYSQKCLNEAVSQCTVLQEKIRN